MSIAMLISFDMERAQTAPMNDTSLAALSFEVAELIIASASFYAVRVRFSISGSV
jgi:hypothetical protein